MKENNDSYILTLLCCRSEEALEAVNKSYGKLLHKLVYRITGNREDTEEVISDTLMDVWNTPPDSIKMSLMSFVCMIARRRAIDKVRVSAAKRRNKAFNEIQSELVSDFNEAGVTDSMVISAVTDEFLASLSSEDRYIFLRRYFEYADYSDICSELPIKYGALRTRIHRMREEFKKRLAAAGIAP